MKVAAVTLGCKVNQYESEAICSRFAAMGYTVTDPADEADVYIINSCSVTAESDRKTRQTVRKYKRLHPNSLVVLTGCMPQAFPQDAAKLTEADIVVGNRSNSDIPRLVSEYDGTRTVAVAPHESGEPFCCDTVSSFHDRTRATLKVEDGCNRFCSYCIIPYARGRVRSKPLAVIEEEAASLAKAGYREIVLVGINLSAYGLGTGLTIVDAVKAAAKPQGILRVRLGSLEPDHITDKIIEGLRGVPAFCPQFHISLQSGCDNTLKRMNRHYTAAEYALLCRKLREAFEDVTLTTDVMVGFAGETAADFEDSLAFVKEIGFEKVHVFPYSRRPGTVADRMPDQITKAEKEARAGRMITQTEAIRQEFLRRQIGKKVTVIPEEHSGRNEVHGYTANYTPVKIKGSNIPFGEPVAVTVEGVEGDWCVGTLAEK